MQCDRAQELLSAYRDGELLPSERRDVEAHIADCRSCSNALADDERIGRAVRGLGRVAPSAGLAARVKRALDQAAGKAMASVASTEPIVVEGLDRRGRGPLIRQIAALAACCVLSSLATWGVMTTASHEIDRIGRDVATAHIRSLLQDAPVQVRSSDQHTVRPWFAGRADFAPEIKDLGSDGFPLVGGRIDYVADRRVAVAVFNRRLHLVNVFMWPSASASDAPASLAVRNGYNLLSWTRGGIVYWAASDLNAEELRLLQMLL